MQFFVVGANRPRTSTFSFSHLETLNTPLGGGLCASGEVVGAGLIASGCADRVTATLNREQSETLEIDGVSYVLDILGFRRDGELLTNFGTQKNLSNGAELLAIFRVEEGTPTVSEIPLPAIGLLVLVGLA